ncbi:MAG: nucleotide sugar dehydrogenase [Candidatus Lokiarchaeia archaeon]
MNITVIGIGRLGICFALCYENAGYNVLGIDISENYAKMINEKNLVSFEPNVMEYLKNSKNLRVSTSLEEGLEFSDAIFIMLDTPNRGGENFYDHTKLSNLLMKINDFKVKNKHIIICCTIMPTYINRIGKYLLNDCNNTTLNYNPEFIAQGDIIKGLENPDLILIGEETKESGDIIEEINLKAIKNKPYICRMNPLEAEITKIGINGFITMKISYANMIGDAAKRIGADGKVILNTIGSDSRIGIKYLNPGYSFGGPCFPRDTLALSQFLRNIDIKPIMIDATGNYNNYHTQLQVNELLEQDLDVYTFEDVCYKPNCHLPIIEESAKLAIAQNLVKKGKKVIIRDFIQVINEVKKDYGNIFSYEIIKK